MSIRLAFKFVVRVYCEMESYSLFRFEPDVSRNVFVILSAASERKRDMTIDPPDETRSILARFDNAGKGCGRVHLPIYARASGKP